MNPTAHPPSPDSDGDQEVLRDLEALESELARQKDLYLRLAADFENFRRRTAQESERRAGAQKHGFIRDLLPVIDNLERALTSGASARPDQFRTGVQIISQQLSDLLRRHGVEAEESLGQVFDPHRHEAIASRQDPHQPNDSVLEVSQRGYRRGNEVFRPAKVIVNRLPEPEPVGSAAER